jgi:dTDP-glucose 4,6-dehydratase
MNILVTGGNGFLGSNTIKKLIEKNHNILITSKNKTNLTYLKDDTKIIPCYINNICYHIDEIKNFSPDVIIFFGWHGGNNYKDTNILDQFHQNVPPHITFLEQISTFSKKPKIIGVGSFSEYGDYNIPINETCIENPTSLYGLSKLTFKKYSEMFCKQHQMQWTWIRPCFIYGPNDIQTRVIPSVIKKALNNEKIHLNECNTILDYLYVEDFVNFLYKLIDLNCEGVYNICSGKQYQLQSIINQICALSNSNSEIIFDKSLNRKGLNNFICGDNTKIQNTTGYFELHNIHDGLLKTINYYNQ